MGDYQIITDSACDMNQDILDEHGIAVIPMEVAMDDGSVFMHYPDFRNFEAHAFYDQLRLGNLAHTSQITPEQYEEFFTPYLEAGTDVLFTGLSSGLSGSFEAARATVERLSEQYPERKILAVDSLCACGGEGVFAVRAALNKEAGMTIDENAQWLTDNRQKLSHYFTCGDLFYLHKGGRVSRASAIVGTALNIKPMLIVDEQGRLQVIAKVRGQKVSYNKLIDYTLQTIVDPEDQILYISHTDLEEEAKALRERVLEKIPCRDVVITRIGPVVGTHTGPTHMCLFSFGTGRRPQ